MLWKQTQIQVRVNLYVPFKNMEIQRILHLSSMDLDLYYVNNTAPTGSDWKVLSHPYYPLQYIFTLSTTPL